MFIIPFIIEYASFRNQPGIRFINVPVVYMALDVMFLMRSNPFGGPLECVGPAN